MQSAQGAGTPSLPFYVSVLCAALPFIAVHVSYLLAASDGQVGWCLPYIDSCTSISATGRHPPASFVFRGVMLPTATLIMLFWWLHWRWLVTIGSPTAGREWLIPVLGGSAGLGLILYVTVLGEVGDLWRLQRRIGTVLFFSFTFLAQLLLAARLRTVAPDCHPGARDVGGRLLRVCQLMLVIGVFSVVAELISDDWHNTVEDAIEWQLAFLLQLNFLLCAALWRRGEWSLDFRRDDHRAVVALHDDENHP